MTSQRERQTGTVAWTEGRKTESGFKPWPRQELFDSLDCQEALYGGAAGGGKSEALLLWLSRGVHVSDYTGLIFRRTYPQLSRSNEGLIAKAKRMYGPMGGIWNGSEHQFRFPTGAMIELGHLQHEKSVEDYQGPSYHRIAFDELSQFTETQYTYLFSRIRKLVGYPITLGMRAASNPGGEGHRWVKNRFVTTHALDAMLKLKPDEPCTAEMIYWPTPKRAFVPARLADNPSIDAIDYTEKLSELPPVTRARLLAGDWRISDEGLIKADWFRYYEMVGPYYRLLDIHGAIREVIEPKHCRRFQIVDCAGSSEDVAKEKRGKPLSYSVISTFDFVPTKGIIIMVDMDRGRWAAPELVERIRSAYTQHNPAWIGVENEKTGMAVLGFLRSLPMRPISHEGKGKAERFVRASNEMYQGRIYFPRDAAWRDVLESELLSWTGHPDEPFDIGDTIGYAGLHADRTGGKQIVVEKGLFSGGWR